MAGARVSFEFESVDAERRFLRQYLAEAWQRFEASECFETGWFWRFGQFNDFVGRDEGHVAVVFDGDPDELVESEAPNWRAFDGLVSWELHRYEDPDAFRAGRADPDGGYDGVLEEQTARKGERGGEWQYRLLPLTARFSLAYLREFDEPLPAVGERSEDNPAGVGFWSIVHYAAIQCGYDWYDETDACLKGIEFRLKTLVSDFDPETALEEYERIRSELAAYEEELEAWIDEHPDGEAKEL